MNIEWNAGEYKNTFSFVPSYGKDVINLLDVPEGSEVLDLGCGNGTLSRELKERGYHVTGMDASEDMLKKAKQDHPDITFVKGNAVNFVTEKLYDAIFSNAVLHWIDADKQEDMIANIGKALKHGGKFVFEFGGKGCAETVHSALDEIFAEHGQIYPRVFYFPTIGEYATILEKNGFKVEYALLFDRPTPQIGEDGLKSWILMFVKAPFLGIENSLKEKMIDEAVKRLKPVLYQNKTWIIDYVRIRMKAVKL